MEHEVILDQFINKNCRLQRRVVHYRGFSLSVENATITMNSFDRLVSVCAMILALVGCDSGIDSGDTIRLDRTYDIVLGVLVPNIQRGQPVEVFVGEIVPSKAPGPSTLGMSADLNRLMLSTRNTFRGELRGNSLAKVIISNGSGAAVEL